MNLYLIGYRCCGKTSVGEYLSHRLNRPFTDADVELERVFETTIPQLVAEKGWDYFRQCEREILAALCARKNQIVATGGGAVLAADNRRLLRDTGVAVWLNASADTIRARMQGDETQGRHRPPLTPQGVLAEIAAVLETRRKFYAETSNLEIQTDGQSIEAIGRLITTYLEASGGQHGR